MNRLSLLAILVAVDLPAQEPTPARIEIPQSMVCGTDVKGKVHLSGPVRTDGFRVEMTSSQPSTIEAASDMRVVKDQTFVNLEVKCIRGPQQPIPVTITARAGGGTTTATIQVLRSVPTSVTTSGSVTGGRRSTIKVTLSRAPYPGNDVQLSSSNPTLVQVPSSIEFDGTSAERTFDVTPGRVSQTTTVNIVATVGETSATGSLRVLPPAVSQVSVSPSTATGGQVAQLNIRLDGDAPANGFSGDITTNNPDLVRVPQGFLVPAGTHDVSVPIQVLRVESAADAIITAGANGVKRNALLKVEPEGPATVSVSPTAVVGGAKATLTVTRTPSPEPLTVLLSADSNATTPASVAFGPNSGSANVTMNTEPVSVESAVKITAKTGAVVRTTFLKLEPPPVTRLTITPSPATGGGRYTVSFAIARAAPNPVTVRTTTYDDGGTYNYDATIPANSTTGSIQIGAVPVSRQTVIRVTAGVFSPGTGRVTGIQSVFLTVNPQ